jgi:hypothetical protein
MGDVQHMVLEGLDDVDWGSLHHAYGPATDVPNMLRGLLSDDKRVYLQAHTDLRRLIGITGEFGFEESINANSQVLAPFMLELLVMEHLQDRWRLMRTIADTLKECRLDTDFQHADPPNVIAKAHMYEVLASGWQLYCDLTIKGEDGPLRNYALVALEQIPHHQIDAQHDIWVHLADEACEFALARKLRLLGYVPPMRSLFTIEEQQGLDNLGVFRIVSRYFYHDSIYVRFVAVSTAIDIMRPFIQSLERSTDPILVWDTLDNLLHDLPNSAKFQSHLNRSDEIVKRQDIFALMLSYALQGGVYSQTWLLNHADLTEHEIHIVGREMIDSGFERLGSGKAEEWMAYEIDSIDNYMLREISDQPGYFYRDSLNDEWIDQSDAREKKSLILRAIIDCDRFWERPTNLFSFFYGLPDDREELRKLVENT